MIISTLLRGDHFAVLFTVLFAVVLFTVLFAVLRR